MAIEVKSTRLVSESDLKGLKAFTQEGRTERRMVVSRDSRRRVLDGIEILPYQEFLADLWNEKLI